MLLVWGAVQVRLGRCGIGCEPSPHRRKRRSHFSALGSVVAKEQVEEAPRLPHQKSTDDEVTIKLAVRLNCRIMDNDNYRHLALERPTERGKGVAQGQKGVAQGQRAARVQRSYTDVPCLHV